VHSNYLDNSQYESYAIIEVQTIAGSDNQAFRAEALIKLGEANSAHSQGVFLSPAAYDRDAVDCICYLSAIIPLANVTITPVIDLLAIGLLPSMHPQMNAVR